MKQNFNSVQLIMFSDPLNLFHFAEGIACFDISSLFHSQ
jgi:hypothetical protein